jgi:hypothetical protein
MCYRLLALAIVAITLYTPAATVAATVATTSKAIKPPSPSPTAPKYCGSYAYNRATVPGGARRLFCLTLQYIARS